MPPGDRPGIPLAPLGPGDRLGPYRIHRRLTSPAGTEVYQAAPPSAPSAPRVRLEVWLPDPGVWGPGAEDAELCAIRWDEHAIFSLIQHPNLLVLLAVGIQEPRYYAVYPWSSARSLRAWLADGPSAPWPLDAALSLARELALGLGALHGWTLDGRPMNVVHRAVGAENILVTARGRALLRPALPVQRPWAGDRWDLARLGALSPEDAAGCALTPASDVASLGSVLYRLLTGANPYEASSLFDGLKQILAGRFAPPRAVRPDLPASVEQLVQRMMARDPGRRHGDGGLLARAIEATAAEERILLGRPAVRRWLREIARRRACASAASPRHPYRD